MRELLFINIGNSGFGVWNDEVADVKEDVLLHRLPLTSKIFAGIAEIEKRIVTIADLAACVGLPQIRKRRCHVLLLSDNLDIAGFAIEQNLRHYEISSEQIFKLPGCLHSQIIDTCVLYSSTPIPVINIEGLCRLVKDKDYSPGIIPFRRAGSGSIDISEIRNYKYLSAGGATFAFPEYNLRDELPAPCNVTSSVLFPDYINGVFLYNNTIVPLISVSRRMDIAETGSEQHAIIMDINDNTFGFLVDSVTGVSDEGIRPVDLPPLVQSAWMKHALIDNQKVISVVDPSVLILPAGDNDKIAPESLYIPENEFDKDFGKKDAEVTEFYILNSIYSLPRSEVKDTIPCKEFSKVPGAAPIVIGVTEYQGGLLPVLDLALYFGAFSPVSPDWKMILVENGNFRAFLITKQVNKAKLIESSCLSRLPIRLPHNVVYGCYPDSETGAMRLILNAESMAVHFDKDYIKEFFHVISGEAGFPQKQTEFPEQKFVMKSPPVIEDTIPFEAETVEEPRPDEEPVPAEETMTETPEEIFYNIIPNFPDNGPKIDEDEIRPGEVHAEEIPEFAEEPAVSPQTEIISAPEIARENISGTGSISGIPETSAETPREEIIEEKTSCDIDGAILPEEKITEEEPPVSVPSEIPPAGEEKTETAAQEIPVEEETVQEIPSSRIEPSKEKYEPSETAPAEIETRPEVKYEQPQDRFESSLPGPDTRADIEKAEEAPEIKPAAIYQTTRPPAKNSYIYAALGLLIIIIIFLISAFLLSERSPADKEKQAVTIEKKNIPSEVQNIKQKDEIITPGGKKIDKTVPDEKAKSAAMNKTTWKKIPQGIMKTGKLKEIPARYDSQTDWDSSPDFIIYNVIKGDELYYITEQFTGNGFDFRMIAKDNEIENPDLIFPEQKIKLKKDYIKK